MKAKWGMIVTDGRGKIGGHVASKNKSGAYFRTKVTPVNPQTSYQNTVRNRLAGLSQAWRSLTQAQRDAWNAAVGAFQKTNVFGDLVSPSGFNLYQRLNNNLLLVEESAINTPPTPGAVDDIVIGTLTAVSGTSLSLAYTAGSGGSILLVFATPSLSPGISFVKSEYRLISASLETDTASPYDAYAAYCAKFGDVGATGQKIFIKTVAISSVTGQAGIPQTTSAIITAI